MTDLVVILTTSVLNLLLGIFVLVRRPKHPVNRLFAAFSLFLIVWTIFNYLADNASSNNLIFTRLTFVAAIAIPLTLFWLSAVFPSGNTIVGPRRIRFQLAFAAIVALISATPLLVPSVTKVDNGVELELGPLYFVYLIYMLQALFMVIVNFRKRFKLADSTEKSQIRFLLAGIVVYAILAIASNLLLPLFVDNWSSSRYGPVFTLFFVALTAYSIIRHRLLDIRLIVARTIAYGALLTTLAAIYSFVVYGIASLITSDSEISQAVVSVSTAMVLAFTAPYLKKRLNRITNDLFYQDSYDTQAFLDELNKELVTNVHLEPLLTKCSEIIESNLKPEYCLFGLRETAFSPQRIIGTARKHFEQGDIDKVSAITSGPQTTIIITDELDQESPIGPFLRKYDIAVLARLVTDLVSEKEGLGYMILGAKKSGSPYNRQDVKNIEIIANELVIAVQNALRFEEIEQFNIKLKQEVEEATHQLRQTNQKLREMDETKDEFISMASHQLRTPLTSVKGYLSMVLEGDVGKVSKGQRQMLDQAFMSSQRMVYLIADLLNVSRLRTGKFIVETVETNLPEVVQGEVDQLKETAATRALELAYDKPKAFPKLMLDETKIRQVIMNFIDNAIYYTPAGGHIQVKLAETPESIEFTVIDDGIGVPRSEQHQLFNKFYRAGNARKARPDGTGLGLFMAKKVVVAQGGSVIFHSVEGKGSTFGFRFAKEKVLPKQQ